MPKQHAPTEGHTADQSIDETNQGKRLDEIHAAKNRVLEKKRETSAGVALDEISQYTAKTVLRSAVEDYIAEVAPTMKKHDEYEEFWLGDEDNPLGEVVLPDGETETIVGLQDLVEADDPYTSEQTHIPPPPPGRSQWPEYMIPEVMETDHIVTQMPRDVLISAFWHINEFLTEIGLDIKLTESLHESEITKEALDDVAKWQKRRGLEYKPENDELNLNNNE